MFEICLKHLSQTLCVTPCMRQCLIHILSKLSNPSLGDLLAKIILTLMGLKAWIQFLVGSRDWVLPLPQHFASIQPESRCLADVDLLWVVSVEPLDVLLVVHCSFTWCNVVAILGPISDLFELYPWKSGVV